MFVLTSKLCLLKKDLKLWNRSVFGNIHELVDKAKKKNENIQLLISDAGYSDELFLAMESQSNLYKEGHG